MSQTKKECRYDILKGLRRAYEDRGHRGPLQAQLGNIGDQYRKDMNAVKDVLEFALKVLAQDGQCDHSAGICYCGIWASVEKVKSIFPLAKEEDCL